MNNNFEIALSVFDDVLDRLSRAARIEAIGSCHCPKCAETIEIDDKEDILDQIDRVIFNEPATVIIFKDGSKVSVKACSKDKFRKEDGFINALIKRILANDVDENGYLVSRGLGSRIEEILKTKSVDQKAISDKNKKKNKNK